MQLWPSLDVYTTSGGPLTPSSRTRPSVFTYRMAASPIRFATEPPLVRMPPLSCGNPTIVRIHASAACSTYVAAWSPPATLGFRPAASSSASTAIGAADELTHAKNRGLLLPIG